MFIEFAGDLINISRVQRIAKGQWGSEEKPKYIILAYFSESGDYEDCVVEEHQSLESRDRRFDDISEFLCKPSEVVKDTQVSSIDVNPEKCQHEFIAVDDDRRPVFNLGRLSRPKKAKCQKCGFEPLYDY